MLQALNEMKAGKAPGPSEVSLELIAAGRGVVIQLVAKICQEVLDEFEMPTEWALSIVVPIFKEKCDIQNVASIELLDHETKMEEMGELAMRNKGIQEVLVRSMMRLYEEANTRVRVDSEEFDVDAGMHQESVLSPFLFALVVDVVTEFARENVLSELLYVDDVFLMSETIVTLRNMFIKWKVAFDSKGLKVNLGNTKVNSITKYGMSKHEVDPCKICIVCTVW